MLPLSTPVPQVDVFSCVMLFQDILLTHVCNECNTGRMEPSVALEQWSGTLPLVRATNLEGINAFPLLSRRSDPSENIAVVCNNQSSGWFAGWWREVPLDGPTIKCLVPLFPP